MTLSEACLSVAAEIEAGTLAPGLNSFHYGDTPNCSLGHVAYRADVSPYFAFFDWDGDMVEAWCRVSEANDRGAWPEVVRRLRELASAPAPAREEREP